MSDQNKDLPAFPAFDGKIYYGGLTKREHFAGLAMQTMIAGEAAQMVANRDGRYNETNWKEVVAMNAIEFADELLKQLEA